MGLRTPLYRQHMEAGAKMVDFAGWDMPLHYGSMIEEHQAVRRDAGVFDVSHMTVVDVSGTDALPWLRRLLANDAGRLGPGQALYSAMCNEDGGVIDDLILYRLPELYRLVTNCATRARDLAWFEERRAGFQVEPRERDDTAMLAVHGPESVTRVCLLLAQRGVDSAEVERVRLMDNFHCLEIGSWFLARTGYTGERGLEIVLPAEQAEEVWDGLLALGVAPVGLGARDTLRLEAGMNLYGHDMDEGVSPLEANMARTIAWEPAGRDFVGRRALEARRREQEEGRLPKLAGLVLEERGVMREGQRVLCRAGEAEAQGVITSGGWSPTLKRAIALARLPAGAGDCRVDLRGKLMPVRVVKPPFVRNGKALVAL